MAALHDTEALRSLADADPGVARDWARRHLVCRGIDAGLPDDPTVAGVAFAAGASPRPLLERPTTARKDLALTATLLDEACRMGALPQGDVAEWHESFRSAARGRGWPSDASFARALAELDIHDPAVFAAASKSEDDASMALLPKVTLAFAQSAGRPLDPIAQVIASELAQRSRTLPDLVPAALAALGLPRVRLDAPVDDLEGALYVGGALSGVDETVPVSPGRGAVRRRMQNAARELLAGVDAQAAAMVRALLAHDDVPPGLLLALAMWIRCVPAAVAPVAAVVDHSAGESPALLARACALPADAAETSLAVAAAFAADPPAAALAARALAQGAPDAALLVDAIRDRGATALDEPRLQAAFAVTLARDPAPLVKWMDEEPRLRPLALYHARHTAHEEVLERLLAWPRPSTDQERGLLGRALSSQGDAAALSALILLRDETGDDALAAEVERARAITGR